MTTIIMESKCKERRISDGRLENASRPSRMPRRFNMSWPPDVAGKICGKDVFAGDDKVVYLRIDSDIFRFRSDSEPIGRGGMGSVRVGNNMRNGERVAIKRINPRIASLPAVKRYARNEAGLVFAHPNLVEMIGCCESEKPKAMFIVSRFVNGVNIDKYVNDSFPQGPKRVRHVGIMMEQLADALDFIHEKEIIHMDLKPANIMVENGSTIKLMDLGIASTAAERTFTSSGLVGTPGYAAPEQYVTKELLKLKVDRRADVYGMAATFYAVVSETRPAANMDYNVPGIGKLLRKELQRAMSADPEVRHATAGEFAHACNEAIKRDQNTSAYRGLYIGLSAVAVAAAITLLSFLIF